MAFLASIGMLVVLGIGAVVVGRLILAPSRRGASSSELARMQELMDAHTAAIEDARAELSDQSAQIAELQERVDFTERALTQMRKRPALSDGDTPE